MFTDITKDDKKVYKITTPGEYIFYFENKVGDITFDVQCVSANIQVYGLYQGNGTQNFNLNIIQNHTKPNSKSAVLIKSVLTDISRLNITSTISITKEGHNTTASFINNNLLLNKKAKTIISPQLEVIPGDVECTHATTTSPLDKKQIQYLVARGISTKEAKQLLIDGFVSEIKKYNSPSAM